MSTQDQAGAGPAASVALRAPAGKVAPIDPDVLAGQPPLSSRWTIRLHTDIRF